MPIMYALIAQNAEITLNAGGWIMMIVSIGLVCGLCAFCLYRILKDKGAAQ
jgi:ABC-type nickel/cobalt efflux system permease component RcnA